MAVKTMERLNNIIAAKGGILAAASYRSRKAIAVGNIHSHRMNARSCKDIAYELNSK